MAHAHSEINEKTNRLDSFSADETTQMFAELTTNLCSLLDEIENHADDEDTVLALCRLRFKVAQQAGFRVEFFSGADVGHA